LFIFLEKNSSKSFEKKEKNNENNFCLKKKNIALPKNNVNIKSFKKYLEKKKGFLWEIFFSFSKNSKSFEKKNPYHTTGP
jgi:hypothetical protein